MTRQELALLMLAQGEGKPFSPVQVQKALFLVTKNLPGIVTRGAPYRFEPYSYGPFDRAVYDDLRALERQGLVEAVASSRGRWSDYRSTESGLLEAEKIAERTESHDLGYLADVVRFVRSLSFAQLVSAIYRAYPDMRNKSIFVG